MFLNVFYSFLFCFDIINNKLLIIFARTSYLATDIFKKILIIILANLYCNCHDKLLATLHSSDKAYLYKISKKEMYLLISLQTLKHFVLSEHSVIHPQSESELSMHRLPFLCGFLLPVITTPTLKQCA